MALYILATIIFLGSSVGLIHEVRSQGKWSYKNPKLVSGVLVFLGSLLLFIATDRAQQRENAEKALMQEQQTSALKKVGHLQEEERLRAEHALKEQRLTAENNANAQEKQLLKAKDIERAQAAVIKLQKEQNESSKRLIESQEREIQLLERVSLNYNLSEVEISFKPSADHWALIVGAFRAISPLPEVPYSLAVMKAERKGEHWKVNFESNKTGKGIIRLPTVHTDRTGNESFEDVIRVASIGLEIEWGNGTTSAIEPLSNDIDELASAIKISQDEIALILRHPKIVWNLNELKDRPEIRLRGRNYVTLKGQNFPVKIPHTLRIRSLDPGVNFDETINPNWKVSYGETLRSRLLPYVSETHRLHFEFSRLSPVRRPVVHSGNGTLSL